MPPIGLVIIGRNEGERLRRCLESSLGHAAHAVYVDSGSTDGSVELARSLGVDVVQLDTTIPFTAARARNSGTRRLLEIAPEIPYVQFVDGDCEINANWWEAAVNRLETRHELAAVCGRRRERIPELSAYNRMCDLEWNTPIGDALECGGDSMMRVEYFQAVQGFNDSLIAGEEPELCLRLRDKGWKIERIDAEMTLHDAAMTHFSQWWRREKRTGYAFAEGAALFGNTPERFRVRNARRNWFWGLLLPLLAIIPAWYTRGLSLILIGAYPVQWFRLYRFCRGRKEYTSSDARLYTNLCLLAKFPQMAGQMKYLLARVTRQPSKLIEYKGPPPITAPPLVRETASSATNVRP
jgi:GT2 family glycosyltransferase